MTVHKIRRVTTHAVDRDIFVVGQRRLVDAQVADIKRPVAPDQQQVQESILTIRTHEGICAERRREIVRAQNNRYGRIGGGRIGPACQHILRLYRCRVTWALSR